MELEKLIPTRTKVDYLHVLIHNKTNKIVAQVVYDSPKETPYRILEIAQDIKDEGYTYTHNVYTRTTIIKIEKIA